MKKKIKFRGKRIDTGEWVYGDLIQLDNQVCIATSEMWATEFSRGTIELQCAEVHPDSVGQFTGLKDKNGVNIYEGDVMENIDCLRGEVVFDEHRAMFIIADGYNEPLFNNNNYREVIGNITDNPEIK